MSKWKKVGLIVVLGLILITVVLAIAVPLLFRVDRYRPLVAAQIQQKTGKPAQIGHLALTVFPQVAIRVDDFSLGNPAGFPAGNFLTAKKIYAVVKPFALLHHSVEITSLELDNLTLNMLEDTQGKWNFENPPAAGAPGPPPGDSRNGSFTLGVISEVTVTRGQFSAASLLASGSPGPALVDVHGATIELQKVNLSAFTTASLQQTIPAPAVLSESPSLITTVLAYAQDSQGPVVAEGTFKADSLLFGDLTVTTVSSNVRLYPKQVFADDLNLTCYRGSVKGNLSLNFGGTSLVYGVDAQLKGVDVGELLTAFPQAKGRLTGTLDGTAKMNGLVTHSTDPLAGITGSGQAAIRDGKMPSLRLNENLRSLAKLAGVGPASGDPSSFSSLAADFRIADGKLASNKITLVGNGLDVDGSGSLSMAGAGSLDYQGTAGLAASGNNPLTSVLAGLGGGKVENGKITFPFTVAGTFAQPKFSLKGGSGGVAGAPGNEVKQDVNAVKGIAGLFKKKQ